MTKENELTANQVTEIVKYISGNKSIFYRAEDEALVVPCSREDRSSYFDDDDPLHGKVLFDRRYGYGTAEDFMTYSEVLPVLVTGATGLDVYETIIGHSEVSEVTTRSRSDVHKTDKTIVIALEAVNSSKLLATFKEVADKLEERCFRPYRNFVHNEEKLSGIFKGASELKLPTSMEQILEEGVVETYRKKYNGFASEIVEEIQKTDLADRLPLSAISSLVKAGSGISIAPERFEFKG